MFVVLLCCCAIWWFLGVLVLLNLWSLPSLAALAVPEREEWPSVAVIAPARNEAAALEEAISQRLSNTYPALEVCLVNDRSTDETGVIAERLAESEPRLKVLHIDTLPEGWLGKVHALQKGVESTEAEWVLLSDADVLLAPGVLHRAVGYCEERGLEVLAAMPTMLPTGAWLNALHAVFLRVLYAAFNRWAVEHPKLAYGVGVGAFTLVRRKALLAAGGFATIRLEVADDLMLGRVLKQSGASCSIVNGAGICSVDIYPKVMDFVLGAEKNAWAVSARFSVVRGMLTAIVFLCLDLAPWLLCLLGSGVYLWLGVATALWSIGISTVALLANGRHGWGALYYPLGSLLFAYAAIRGTWLGWRNGGLQWRGTFYPTRVLADWDAD